MDSQIFKSISGTEIHAVFGNVKFADLQMIKYAISRQKAPIYTMGSADLRSVARGTRTINGALIFSHLSTQGLVEQMSKAGAKVFLSNDELANYNGDYMKGGELSQEQRLALRAGGTIAKVGTVDNQSTFDPFSVGQDVLQLESFGQVTEAYLADQLPPFDITLVGIPETIGTVAGDVSSAKVLPQSLIIRGVEFVSEASGTSIEDLVIEKQLSFIARSVDSWKSVKF